MVVQQQILQRQSLQQQKVAFESTQQYGQQDSGASGMFMKQLQHRNQRSRIQHIEISPQSMNRNSGILNSPKTVNTSSVSMLGNFVVESNAAANFSSVAVNARNNNMKKYESLPSIQDKTINKRRANYLSLRPPLQPNQQHSIAVHPQQKNSVNLSLALNDMKPPLSGQQHAILNLSESRDAADKAGGVRSKTRQFIERISKDISMQKNESSNLKKNYNPLLEDLLEAREREAENEAAA